MIDPDLARKWLERLGPDQREVDERLVLRYAYDMRRGWWNSTFNPYVFDENGDLENGQHRLLAIIAADVTVRGVVLHRCEGR